MKGAVEDDSADDMSSVSAVCIGGTCLTRALQAEETDGEARFLPDQYTMQALNAEFAMNPWPTADKYTSLAKDYFLKRSYIRRRWHHMRNIHRAELVSPCTLCHALPASHRASSVFCAVLSGCRRGVCGIGGRRPGYCKSSSSSRRAQQRRTDVARHSSCEETLDAALCAGLKCLRTFCAACLTVCECVRAVGASGIG